MTAPALPRPSTAQPTAATSFLKRSEAPKVAEAKIAPVKPALAKTESAVETMADGEGKIMAQKEIAAAQDAMLGGKMGACSMHLSKAMHDAGMAK